MVTMNFYKINNTLYIAANFNFSKVYIKVIKMNLYNLIIQGKDEYCQANTIIDFLMVS